MSLGNGSCILICSSFCWTYHSLRVKGFCEDLEQEMPFSLASVQVLTDVISDV